MPPLWYCKLDLHPPEGLRLFGHMRIPFPIMPPGCVCACFLRMASAELQAPRYSSLSACHKSKCHITSHSSFSSYKWNGRLWGLSSPRRGMEPEEEEEGERLDPGENGKEERWHYRGKMINIRNITMKIPPLLFPGRSEGDRSREGERKRKMKEREGRLSTEKATVHLRV